MYIFTYNQVYIYIYYNIHNYRLWTVYIFAWHLNPFRWESTDHFNPLGLARVSVFEICIVWRKRHLQYISLKYLPWPSGPFSERAAASLYSSDSSWKLPIPLLGPRKALDGHNIIPGALEVSRHLTIFQGRFVQFATDSFDCLVWTLVDEVAQEIIVLVLVPSTFCVCPLNWWHGKGNELKWCTCSQNRLTNRYSEQQRLFELAFLNLDLGCMFIDMRLWFRQDR